MAWACPVCNQINDDDSFIKCLCGYEIEADKVKQHSVELTGSKSKLPVSIIKEAFRLPWQNRAVMIKALIFPSLLLATLRLLSNGFETITEPVTLFLLGLHFIIFTMFGVTCHRIILLGSDSVPPYGIYSWTMRETRFLGWYIAVHLWLSIITLPNVIMDYYGINDGFIIMVTRLILLLAGTYVLSRLSILLPATAIDKRCSTAWAWTITIDNGVNLMIILSIPAFLYAPFYLLVGYSAVTDFIAYFMQYVVMAIGIAALSLSYKFLNKRKEHNNLMERNAEERRPF